MIPVYWGKKLLDMEISSFGKRLIPNILAYLQFIIFICIKRYKSFNVWESKASERCFLGGIKVLGGIMVAMRFEFWRGLPNADQWSKSGVF